MNAEAGRGALAPGEDVVESKARTAFGDVTIRRAVTYGDPAPTR